MGKGLGCHGGLANNHQMPRHPPHATEFIGNGIQISSPGKSPDANKLQAAKHPLPRPLITTTIPAHVGTPTSPRAIEYQPLAESIGVMSQGVLPIVVLHVGGLAKMQLDATVLILSLA